MDSNALRQRKGLFLARAFPRYVLLVSVIDFCFSSAHHIHYTYTCGGRFSTHSAARENAEALRNLKVEPKSEDLCSRWFSLCTERNAILMQCKVYGYVPAALFSLHDASIIGAI